MFTAKSNLTEEKRKDIKETVEILKKLNKEDLLIVKSNAEVLAIRKRLDKEAS